MIPFILTTLLLGLPLWWLYYGLECFINGASGGWKMPFQQFLVELKWNLPFVGRRNRLEYLRERRWEHEITTLEQDLDLLPGRLHFAIICYIPFIPWCAYLGWVDLYKTVTGG